MATQRRRSGSSGLCRSESPSIVAFRSRERSGGERTARGRKNLAEPPPVFPAKCLLRTTLGFSRLTSFSPSFPGTSIGPS
jgi:hypothetical protein